MIHLTAITNNAKRKQKTHTRATRIQCSALIFSIISLFIFATSPAFAQDKCENLTKNSEWTDNLAKLVQAVQNDDLNEAQVLSKKLNTICQNAPVLNYVQGKMYEKLGDKSNALYAYQKASENTYHFAIDPDTAQKIWYARYEFEHPERTAAALNKQSDKIADLQAQSEQHLDAFSAYKEQHYKEISRLLWTGTGVGAGGLAMIGAGIALVAMYPSSSIEQVDGGKKPNLVHEEPLHSLGWAFVGVGAGLLVGGTVLAGIYGYKYTHFKTDNAELSFSISPTSLSFGLAF